MKANYRLTQHAKDDLRRIYRHGFEQFGERRADQYFQDFFERFERIAENPLAYPKADNIAKDLRKTVCGKDSIYYQIEPDGGVTILFILGRQDIKKKLKAAKLK